MASIICGCCRETHASVAEVAACYDERAEQEIVNAQERYAEDAYMRYVEGGWDTTGVYAEEFRRDLLQDVEAGIRDADFNLNIDGPPPLSGEENPEKRIDREIMRDLDEGRV